MNIYLIMYCGLHAGIVILLFFNLIIQFAKMKSIRISTTDPKSAWESDRNITRARTFLHKSAVGLLATIFFQGFAFWLLWMAGTFDK